MHTGVYTQSRGGRTLNLRYIVKSYDAIAFFIGRKRTAPSARDVAQLGDGDGGWWWTAVVGIAMDFI